MKETIPFTYKLIFKPTGQYYYGVRWAKGCNPLDLWTIYFSSSNPIKKLIKEYGKDSFSYKVTKIFENKKDASNWEINLLKRVDAKNNGKFINKVNSLEAFDIRGLKWIHHLDTGIEAMHNPEVKIPEGWEYGHSKTHIENNRKSQEDLYQSGIYKPWNSGGGKPTGPCSEQRKKSIKDSRLKTRKNLCPHCNKEFDPGNFKLFHGDRCKNNPNVDPLVFEERSRKAKESMIKQKENGTFSKPKAPSGIFICPNCKKEGINYGNMMKNHFSRCKFI